PPAPLQALPSFPTRRSSDLVLGGVLRAHSAPVEPVVERRDGLAQLPHAGHGRVILVGGIDVDMVQARRRSGQLARLGLALAETGDRKSTRLNSSHSQISYAV